MAREKFLIKTGGQVLPLTGDALSSVETEVKGYSITPRTLNYRTLLDIDVSQRIASDLDFAKAKKKSLEEYKLKIKDLLGELSRPDYEYFGRRLEMKTNTNSSIDTIASDIDLKIGVLNAFIANAGQVSNLGNLFFIDEYVSSDDKVAINRFGFNFANILPDRLSFLSKETQGASFAVKSTGGAKGAEKTGSVKSAIDEVMKLQSPIELVLLKEAVEHLKKKTDSITVLVDILRRDAEGKIVLEEGGKPSTHTIVLSKTNINGKFVMIDPNDSNHSKHLVLNSEILLEGFSILLPVGEGNKELTLKIYTGKQEKTGPENDQFRDCIDIAVKLALGFQKQGVPLDHTKLTDNEVVMYVSNNSKIDKFAPTFIGEEPIRIKQRSDFEVLQKFWELEKVLGLDLSLLRVLDKSTKFDESYKNVLCSSILQDQDMVTSLCGEHKKLLAMFSSGFDQRIESAVKIIGETLTSDTSEE
jgi:hypothetical protein